MNNEDFETGVWGRPQLDERLVEPVPKRRRRFIKFFILGLIILVSVLFVISIWH